MANLNRDLVIQVDAKNSTLIGGNFKFFITDKHTSNFFVKLVINMSTNSVIQKYVALENASSYSTQLVAKKPNNEVLYINGVLLDEQEALFLYDLTEEQLGVIGTYKCELRIKSAVNDRVEVITTNPFTFEVLPSIVNDLDVPVDDVGLYPMYEEILARVTALEGGDINGDINQMIYATKEYVNSAIESIDVTDQLDDYATKSYVDEAINALRTELMALINSGGVIKTPIDLSEVYPIVNSYLYADGTKYEDTRGRGMYDIPLSDYSDFYITATSLYSAVIMLIYDSTGAILGTKGNKTDGDVTWTEKHIVVSDLLAEYPTAHHISLSSFTLVSADTVLTVRATPV